MAHLAFRYLFKIIKENVCLLYLAVAWDLTRDTFRWNFMQIIRATNETQEPLREQKFELCQEVLANMESASHG